MTHMLHSTVNICGGAIEIDGIDTRNVGLKTLRGRLALVPQDNVLFKGTLRQNLYVSPATHGCHRTQLEPFTGTQNALVRTRT